MKRFENPAQLVRHIADTENIPTDEVWEQYEIQLQ